MMLANEMDEENIKHHIYLIYSKTPRLDNKLNISTLSKFLEIIKDTLQEALVKKYHDLGVI